MLADRDVLVAFYEAMGGLNWNEQANWLSGRPIGEWFGVTTNEDGRVVKLALVENGLRGELPTQTGELTELEVLELERNEMTGSLPVSFGKLSNLTVIDLDENELSGELPRSLSMLGELEVLSLFSNAFSGNIPEQLDSLGNLKVLDLGSNDFSGEIPGQLGELGKLRILRLDDNRLAGEIPPEFGDLRFVEELLLSGNRLSGPIPSELEGLASVKWLRLGSNLLSGPIPDELAQLSTLIELDLSNNRLSGPIPKWLGDFGELTALHMAGNLDLTGCLTEELSRLENNDFEQLGLGLCESDPGPRNALVALYNATDGPNWKNNRNWLSDLSVGEWHGVRTDLEGRVVALDLEDNNLSGEIPSAIGQLGRLTYLRLNRNNIRGTIPPEIGQLSEIDALFLDDNGLEGELPDELASLAKLTFFSAAGNRLTGPIPSWVGGFSNLERIALADNRLSGEIPVEFGDLSNLVLVRLYENELTGNIPAELGALAKLEWLDVSSNRLTGEIPVELARISELKELSVHSNLLDGEVPVELGMLTRLQKLRLHFNRLSGSIPTELVDLSSLEEFEIRGNKLTGCLPDGLVGVKSNDLSNVDLPTCSEVVDQPVTISDRDVLVALYDATDGPNWNNNRNWLSDEPIRFWHGVTADGRGKVIELNLHENNLNGTIPPEIGQLTELRSLVLRANELSGELPSELGDLENLVLFSAYENALMGRIPSEFGNLSKLEVLTLYKNRLSGGVPKELGNLTNLLNLRLDFNQLSGSLPPELGNLRRLENFEILENNLSGEIPDEIGSLPRLRQLFLSRNAGISGCIPDSVVELDSNDLHDVNLPACGEVEREVLMSFFEETRGENWSNSDGWSTDAPISGWYGITTDEFGRVISIDLSGNNVSGEIPNAFGRLSKLGEVLLAGNAISGCIPLSVVDLPTNDFGELMLSECGVYFPDYWFKTAMLEILGKEEGSEISPSDLAALESLDLSWSAIRDLEGLQYATNLKSLTLGVSRSRPRPDENSYRNFIQNLAPLGQLTNLTELNLGRSRLSDISALSTLTNLKHLDIGFNEISHLGSVSGLHNLETLLASNNRVDDVTDLAELGNLIRVDLSDNKIVDIAPLSGVAKLQELDISDNEVADLAHLSGLEELQRLEMKGTGVVDLSSLEDLRQLTYLDASWNEFEDLSSLEGLEGLETLMIGPGPISDISALEGLSDLRQLRIVGTDLTDIEPLGELVNLRSLVLTDNRITDIGSLASLGDLEILDLNFNQIIDVSAMAGLGKLKDLRLNGNPINDIEPLVSNPGLGRADHVELDDEVRKSANSRLQVRRLTDRDVDVEYGKVFATAFGGPKIHKTNVVVLPSSRSVVSPNFRLEDYTSDFYEMFEDEFDFLIVMSNIELGDDPYRRYRGAHYAVSNEVEGIGIDPFHNDGWGSDKRLQGLVHLPYKQGFGEGPVLHELMHRWGNSIVEGLGAGAHWGWSDVHRQLGGFESDELVDLGGGRYNAGHFGPGGFAGDFLPYAALELYIAGLGPADEVPDWISGVDAGFSFTADGRVEEHEDRGHVFTVKEFETHTIDEIIAMHGPRVPDYSTSQKEFRAVAILLIDEAHPAITEVVDEISRHVTRFTHPGEDEEWLYNFYEATKGRGTMLMGDLSEFLKDVEEE